jgi:hypothetical protein
LVTLDSRIPCKVVTHPFVLINFPPLFSPILTGTG